ncbi:DegQ family serine endoprotease [Desulfogranum japonicum]|uniref:DegQ family serine endoprotease n=1 Tax=Desulfogranum japonicum TaxID=231447 RepID=UPI0004052830|nr:DegQ family serine endoprotease [Desulfogranum japonicum]
MNQQQPALRRRNIWTSILVCLTLLIGSSLSAVAQDDADIALLDRSAKAFTSVVKKASPAVVYIGVEKSVAGQQTNPLDFFNDPLFERFFGPQFRQQPHNKQQPRQYHQKGAGSGFIIASDGYILTNNHVVSDTDKITVRLDDEREFPAKVIGTDPQSDVALIKIDAKDLPVLPLGDSEKLQVGEWVIAIGSPFELSQSVTVGVVSAKGRNRVGIADYENFIQTDAAINPGNSGGPLLNIRGEVVGINTAIFSRSGGYMGIGFAIPINMAKSIKEQLISSGKVVRGWLGVMIQDMNEDLAKSFDLDNTKGVLVSEVTDGSPAQKAGLKQGDVIVSLNGAPLHNVADLRNKVAMTAPETDVTFGLIRDGKNKDITVTIGEQPSDMAKISSSPAKEDAYKTFGLSLQDLTPEVAKEFGYEEGQGVLIADVDPDSAAARVGLQSGQLIEEVNKKRVHSMDELKAALDASRNKNQVLFRVRAGEYSHYVVLRSE